MKTRNEGREKEGKEQMRNGNKARRRTSKREEKRGKGNEMRVDEGKTKERV